MDKQRIDSNSFFIMIITLHNIQQQCNNGFVTYSTPGVVLIDTDRVNFIDVHHYDWVTKPFQIVIMYKNGYYMSIVLDADMKYREDLMQQLNSAALPKIRTRSSSRDGITTYCF
jgi:hypothetical protein